MVVKLVIELHTFVTSSGLAPIIEFGMVGFIIMVTYMAMHAAFSGAGQIAKFVMASLVGLTGYAVGKLIIITWIINPLISQNLYRNPFS